MSSYYRIMITFLALFGLIMSPIAGFANYGTPNNEVPYDNGPSTAQMNNISVTAGQQIILTSPLAGVSKIEATFLNPVSDGVIGFSLSSGNSIRGDLPSGNPLLVIDATYAGLTKDDVRFDFEFSLKTTSIEAFTAIVGYYFNSPATEFAISRSGVSGSNTLFAAGAPGAAQYVVAGVGSTIVTGQSTVTSIITVGLVALVGIGGYILINQNGDRKSVSR